MSGVREKAELNDSLRPTHTSKLSQETNASGIAESTISFSQFPPPPSSIPSTPIRSDYGTPPPSRSTFSIPVHPLVPRKLPPQPQVHSPQHGTPPLGSNVRSHSREGFLQPQGIERPLITPHRPSPPQSLSPYDWHDGASSIDVDATEDRLLSTSFITSLLQENKDRRKAQRTSYASDAISGISEMTYPPLASYPDANKSFSYRPFPHRPAAPRLPGGRPPPTSFAPIAESNNRISCDSETLHSNQDQASIVRTASLSRGIRVHGASVVGVAPATLHSVSASSRPTSMQTDSTSAAPPYEKDVKYGSAPNETDDDSLLQYKTPHPPFSPAGTQRLNFKDSPQHQQEVRASVHSSKSVAPSFMSRISMPASFRRAFAWKKVKPLPPVPIIPHIPLSVENQHRKADESTPLPDLVNRAGTLHGLLEKGYHPHQSFSSYSEIPKPEDYQPTLEHNGQSSGLGSWQPPKPLYHNEFGSLTSQTPIQIQRTVESSRFKFTFPNMSKRVHFVVAFFIAGALAGIITAILVTIKRNKSKPLSCTANVAGTLCNLNATCVCTSSGQCNALAQNLIDLIPITNQQFSSNLTIDNVYNSLWLSQGSPGGNCAPQSILVDVGKALNQHVYPNRTLWAQAALLWNVVQSQDLLVADKMQKFVQTAPWNKLGSVDGPLTAASTSPFLATFGGYAYDFAAQTVNQPAASFITLGQPTNAQIARLGPKAQSALDRVYTFAQASSIQRGNALKNFWTTTLSQRTEDLSTFKTALSVSPILLPFNATSPAIQSLYSNSSSSLFPPPVACYPGLSVVQMGQINSFETSVFGLQTVPIATQFNTTCYQDRPIYGVLDILRLRLPFIDSRTGLPRQAAVLNRDVVPRAVVYAGEMLSTLPNSSPTPAFTSTQLDPRRFGTLNLADHVILEYLSSMPTDIATALVKFVLSTTSKPAIPPNNSSTLFQALPTIPSLEVAIFGSMGPSDVSSTLSAFTTSTGSLFFGSDPGGAFRSWAITAYGGSVVWSESAVSPQIVRDNSFTDATVNDTWKAVSTALHNNVAGVGLVNITDTFQRTQKFTST